MVAKGSGFEILNSFGAEVKKVGKSAVIPKLFLGVLHFCEFVIGTCMLVALWS